jgi:hypothetical protein
MENLERGLQNLKHLARRNHGFSARIRKTKNSTHKGEAVSTSNAPNGRNHVIASMVVAAASTPNTAAPKNRITAVMKQPKRSPPICPLSPFLFSA